jgi:hypothetical protein
MQTKFKKMLIKKGCTGDPSLVKCPPDSWGARGLDHSHVEAVLGSFTESFTINEDINVVRMAESEDYPQILETLKSKTNNKVSIGTFFLTATEDVLGKGPYAEAGMHTCSALKVGQIRFPNNQFFKRVVYNAYLVENTLENRDLMAQLSLQSNKKHMGKKADFKETIHRMISQTDDYELKMAKTMSAEDRAKGKPYVLTPSDMNMFYRRWCVSGEEEPTMAKKKYQQRFWAIAK